MNRRTFHRQALLSLTGLSTLGAATLSGCGFSLRQGAHLAFRTITLTGFAGNSPLATELARALEANGVDVVETTAQAAATLASNGPPAANASAPNIASLNGHVIFEALADNRQQVVASSTAFGQVRDLTLRTRLSFQVLRADGSVLLPPTELLISRDLTYNEKDALAKLNESEALHRAMQSDIVSQVLRRLAVITPERLAAP